MKHEKCGMLIKSFAGLQANTYTFITEDKSKNY